MRKNHLLSLTLTLLLGFVTLYSCKKGDSSTSSTVVGTVQKGPAAKGQKVILIGLDDKLDPTNETLETTTIDDKGNFEFKKEDIEALKATNVKITFSGTTYDEAEGEVTSEEKSVSVIIKKSELLGLSGTISDSAIKITTLTNMETDIIEQQAALTSETVNLDTEKQKAIDKILDAMGITDATERAKYTDMSKLDLTNSALAFSAALTFDDDTKSFLDAYDKQIEGLTEEQITAAKENIDIWKAQQYGEKMRKFFYAINEMKAFYKDKGVEVTIDPTDKSVLPMIEAAIRRDAMDGVASLYVCYEKIGLDKAATKDQAIAKLKDLGIDIESHVTSGDIVLKYLSLNKELINFYKTEGCSDMGLQIYFTTKTGEESKGTCVAATSEIVAALLKNGFEYIGAHNLGTAF